MEIWCFCWGTQGVSFRQAAPSADSGGRGCHVTWRWISSVKLLGSWVPQPFLGVTKIFHPKKTNLQRIQKKIPGYPLVSSNHPWWFFSYGKPRKNLAPLKAVNLGPQWCLDVKGSYQSLGCLVWSSGFAANPTLLKSQEVQWEKLRTTGGPWTNVFASFAAASRSVRRVSFGATWHHAAQQQTLRIEGTAGWKWHKWHSKVSEPKFYNVAFRQKDTPLDSFMFLFAVWKKSCVKKQLEQVFHQLQEKNITLGDALA